MGDELELRFMEMRSILGCCTQRMQRVSMEDKGSKRVLFYLEETQLGL